LAVSGDVLVKAGELDGAEAMFRRLRDCFPDSKVADAAPVGLGDVALARKQYEEALKIFDDALKINPGMSRFKEATLGKLRALVGLERFVAAEKLALEIIGNKLFRVEAVGKAYLQLARIYREKAAKAVGPEATNLLKKALACYQRVEVAYRLYPEIRAEASWEVYQTALELGDEELAEKTLKALME
jgi:tetratricopeptide (TPR) repeat protein